MCDMTSCTFMSRFCHLIFEQECSLACTLFLDSSKDLFIQNMGDSIVYCTQLGRFKIKKKNDAVMNRRVLLWRKFLATI